jgi:hypothetical protein
MSHKKRAYNDDAFASLFSALIVITNAVVFAVLGFLWKKLLDNLELSSAGTTFLIVLAVFFALWLSLRHSFRMENYFRDYLAYLETIGKRAMVFAAFAGIVTFTMFFHLFKIDSLLSVLGETSQLLDSLGNLIKPAPVSVKITLLIFSIIVIAASEKYFSFIGERPGRLLRNRQSGLTLYRGNRARADKAESENGET